MQVLVYGPFLKTSPYMHAGSGGGPPQPHLLKEPIRWVKWQFGGGGRGPTDLTIWRKLWNWIRTKVTGK